MKIIGVRAGLTGLTCAKVPVECGAADVTRWYPETNLEPLAINHVPYTPLAQPPAIHEKLPKDRLGKSGLFLAGEYTKDLSRNVSMFAREKATEEVVCTR
jgi:hypothetical protein